MLLTRTGQLAVVGASLGFSTVLLAKETKPPRKILPRVTKARSFALEGQSKRAEAVLKMVIERAPEQPRIVTPEGVAALWYLKGALALQRGAKGDEAGEAFRWALAVDPAWAWDQELLGDGDHWRYFEALRSEVGSRQMVPVGLPERHGAMVAWLDGRKLTPESTALPGRHLAQVECPDGPVVSVWVTLPKTPKWLKMCPGKLDLDAAPPEASPEEGDDDFGDFDVFGGPGDVPEDDADAPEDDVDGPGDDGEAVEDLDGPEPPAPPPEPETPEPPAATGGEADADAPTP